jgi:hypothetical protein
MTIIATLWLACFAVVLELARRAPECDEHGNILPPQPSKRKD